MSEMVERVAMAICVEGVCGGQVNGVRVLCDDVRISQEVRQLPGECTCREEARAAIKAIREPTEAMRQQARLTYDNTNDCPSSVYEIMIDEALRE